MSSFRRQYYLIVACLVVLLILYWTRSKLSISAADADADNNEMTVELPLSADAQSSPLLTRHHSEDSDSDDDDNSASNLVVDSQLSATDISNMGMIHVSHSASTLQRLPTTASQRNTRDVTSLQPVSPASLSSWQPVADGEQQLKHVVILERRRLAAQKQRLHKLRFDKEVDDIMKEMKKGGVMEVRKKPVPARSALGDIDSDQWRGLNTTFLHTHYPGIVPVRDYVMAEHILSNDSLHASGMQGQPQSLDDMTDGQIEDRFYQLLSKTHVECLEMRRMGSFEDGGYDLCTSQPFHFTPQNSSCLIYSFGINYDFTFDDAMAAAFDCTVKCFDPSMTVADHLRSAKVHFYQVGLGAQNTVTNHGWRLMTLGSIMSKLGHTEKLIDVLKIDIDYAEWACLRQMLSERSLRHVKQLIVEIHTSELPTVGRPTSREDFVLMHDTLAALERAGFRCYHYHYNPLGIYTSVRTGKTRTCCYELCYININFLVPR